jgi:hypothetical protein
MWDWSSSVMEKEESFAKNITMLRKLLYVPVITFEITTKQNSIPYSKA